MEINHLITTICRGGAENQLLTLCRKQYAAGKKVNVIYLKGSPELSEKFLNAGVNVIQIYANRSPIIQIFQIRKHLKDSTSILHCHLPRAEIIGAIARRKNRLVISKHNAEPFFPGALRFFSWTLARFVSMRAAECVAISDAVKDYLLANKEVSKKMHIAVVRYGFDDTFRIDPNTRKELSKSLPSGGPIVGAVGRLTLQKNYPTLLNAFSQYLQNFPNAHLIILGSGPDESYLKELTHTLGMGQCVHFIGNTPQVAEWMSLFEIFVLSSRYEGFGLVLVEAMQVGLPIIAANNSAIPEVLGEDYLGLYPTYDSEKLAHRLVEFSTLKVQEESRIILSERLNHFDPILMEKRINAIYLQAIERL